MSTLQININPKTLSLIGKTQFDGVTTVQQQDSVSNTNQESIFQIMLNCLMFKDYSTLNDIFSEENPIPDDFFLNDIEFKFPI